MKWREQDPNYARSDCGYYTISRDVHSRLYLAWYRPGAVPSSKSGKMPEHLGTFSKFALAANECFVDQQDRLAQSQAPAVDKPTTAH